MPLTLPNAVNDVEIRGFNFAPGTTDVYLDYIKYHPWRRPWLLFQWIHSYKSVTSKEGVDVGEVQTMLLKKIEELTRYIIGQEKRSNAQEQRIKELEMQTKK